ncbi:MAG TPA: C39 family peptidase [Candidatus Saccharimonadales bacterium]|nr:C39 family peptidase [Candidatus Saccharimonadales bacterium]
MQKGRSTDTSVYDRRKALFDYFATQSDQQAGAPILLKAKRPKGLILKLTAIALTTTLVTIFILKTCFAITPVYVKINQVVNQPFTIYLNETVGSIPLSDIKISPAVNGKWTFKSGDLIGRDKIIFTPTSYFKVATTYTVKLPNAKRIIAGNAQISTVNFKTQMAPGLTTGGINGAKNNSTIAADYAFNVDLVTPNKGLRKLELRTIPSVPLAQTITKNNQQFTWKPTGLLPQGTTLSIQVYDAKNDVVLATKTLKVAPTPAITIPVKKYYFGENDVATITFNQPIEPDSSKYISFSIPGQGEWQSDTVYKFTPTKVSPGQTYSYTLSAGLRSKSGGIVTTNQTSTFSTVGPVTVIGSSPYGTDLSQSSERISFTFDQPVDHTSVANHFSISSGEITSTSWQDNTFNAEVTNLGYQRTVTATLSPGIQNAGFGLPSTQIFKDSFTTELRTTKLNIPYFHQQYAATCAAASLRMVLAYKGISTDDMSIVNKMGYNPTVENKSTNPPTWDDPQLMFVGSVNGTIKAGTSAGPDAQPVAKAAEAFGVSASAVTGIGVNWIAQQIFNGDPVIFFGAYSNTSFTSWKTPSGRIETMNLTSHARVVTGLLGEPSSPVGFWISDPISGSSYWTASQVAASINLDAYHQGVVVY